MAKHVIAHLMKKNLSDDERNDLIDKIVETVDYNIELLDYDKEHNSLKLLGLVCSYELINSIYTSIFTVGLAAVQYLYAGM